MAAIGLRARDLLDLDYLERREIRANKGPNEAKWHLDLCRSRTDSWRTELKRRHFTDEFVNELNRRKLNELRQQPVFFASEIFSKAFEIVSRKCTQAMHSSQNQRHDLTN